MENRDFDDLRQNAGQRRSKSGHVISEFSKYCVYCSVESKKTNNDSISVFACVYDFGHMCVLA